MDNGDLIVAGSGGQELFHIAQTDKLRVYVRVPEPNASGIAPGQTATLSLSIYHLVQLGHDAEALSLLTISVAIAFAAVWASEWFFRRRTQ